MRINDKISKDVKPPNLPLNETCCFAQDDDTEMCGLPATHAWLRPHFRTRHCFCKAHWEEMSLWFETVESFCLPDDEFVVLQ